MLDESHLPVAEQSLVFRLRKRAEIRRQNSDRKSVQEGRPDRISDLLEEAADEIEKLRAALKRARRDALKEAARVAQSYDQGGDYGAAARHISANILTIMEIGSAALGEKE